MKVFLYSITESFIRSFFEQFEVEKYKLLEATREDLQRQHDELLTATRDEHNQHIAQLQHNVKVCINVR